MTADYFFDTNILLYSGSRLSGDSDKRAVAEKLIYSFDCAISIQLVFSEQDSL